MLPETTIFVSGVGGCGVGEGIAKAVLKSGRRYRLVCGNVHPDAPMLFRCSAAYLLPPARHPDYLPTVLSLCALEGVTVFIPGSEAELRVVARRKRDFDANGIILVAAPSDVIETADDKWKTHRFLERNGLGTPASSLVPVRPAFWEANRFPLIVKPRVNGHASQNVSVAGDHTELRLLLSLLQRRGITPLVQALVGSAAEEYTASVVLGPHAVVLGSIVMRRRMSGGFTSQVEVEQFPEVRRECERIAAALGGFGPINIQARMVDGRLVVFEINARFSGTTPFRAAVGFNEVDVLLDHVIWKQPFDLSAVRFGTVGIRGLEEVIVDRTEYEAIPSRADFQQLSSDACSA